MPRPSMALWNTSLYLSGGADPLGDGIEHMDWQFRVGLGVAIIFGLLPYAVKDLPHWFTWAGIAVGLAVVLWGVLPDHHDIPIIPVIIFIIGAAAMAGAAGWIWDHSQTALMKQPSHFSNSGGKGGLGPFGMKGGKGGDGPAAGGGGGGGRATQLPNGAWIIEGSGGGGGAGPAGGAGGKGGGLHGGEGGSSHQREARSGRHLTVKQQRILLAGFLHMPDNPENYGIAVAKVDGDAEAGAYASEFYGVLLRAGIQAGSPSDYSLQPFEANQPQISIAVQDPTHPVSYAEYVGRVLTDAHIGFKYIKAPPIFGRSIVLFVGSAPL